MFLTHATFLAGLAVLLVQQLLKLNFVPNDFANRHPVPTLLILSAVAAVVVVWQTNIHPVAWTDWLVLGASVALVAAISYNVSIKNWSELRAMETPVK